MAGQELDLGTFDLTALLTRSASDDLGLRFFLGDGPPTDADLGAIDKDPALAYRTDPGAGLWIAAVERRGPAGQAGLRRGDKLLSVGQMTIGDGGVSAEQAMRSLSQPWRSRGRPVEWVVERDGRQLRTKILVEK